MPQWQKRDRMVECVGAMIAQEIEPSEATGHTITQEIGRSEAAGHMIAQSIRPSMVTGYLIERDERINYGRGQGLNSETSQRVCSKTNS